MPTTIQIEVPEGIDKKYAKLIFELGLAELTRDFHKNLKF